MVVVVVVVVVEVEVQVVVIALVVLQLLCGTRYGMQDHTMGGGQHATTGTVRNIIL